MDLDAVSHGDPVVQALVDREQIRQLIYQYSFYVDTKRVEELAALMTHDAVVDSGPGRRHVGREAFLQYNLMRLSGTTGASDHNTLDASHHSNANVLIHELDAEVARVTTSVIAWHQVAGEHPIVHGWYEDVVVKTPDGWRFKERVIKLANPEVDFPGGPWEWHAMEQQRTPQE